MTALRRSYQALFHKRPGIELNGSVESLHSTKSGEWEKPLGVQNTPPSPHGPLRSAVIWLSNCGARFTRSCYGLPDSLLVECGATETGMLVGGIICQGIQRPRLLDTMPPVPASLSASTFLMKVASWDGTSQDITQAVTTAFEADDYLPCVKDLKSRGIEPQSYINSLDKVSPYPVPR